MTGCQCLYTWRRLVERIRITGRRRVIHQARRVSEAGTRTREVPLAPRQGKAVYFDIGPADFTPVTQISDDVRRYLGDALWLSVARRRRRANLTRAARAF